MLTFNLKDTLACALILTTTTIANAVEKGDIVLLNRSDVVIKKAKVSEVAKNRVQLIFENSSDNILYGRSFEKLGETVFPYRPVDELDVKSPHLGHYTLRIGSPVIYFNAATAIKGAVRELTADGWVRLEFGNATSNIAYGSSYLRASSALLHEPVNHFVSKTGTQYEVGMDVLLANSAVTQRGKIIEISANGFAHVGFEKTTQNIAYGRFYDLKDQSHYRLIPSGRVQSMDLDQEEPPRRISVDDIVQLRYFKLTQISEERIERVYVGTFIAKVVEISSAGFARLQFEGRLMQLENSEMFFPVGTEVQPLKAVNRFVQREATGFSRLAKLFGKTSEMPVVAEYAVGDEVLVEVAGSHSKAKIQVLTADGRAKFQFEDGLAANTFNGQLFAMANLNIETLRKSEVSCGGLFDSSDEAK